MFDIPKTEIRRRCCASRTKTSAVYSICYPDVVYITFAALLLGFLGNLPGINAQNISLDAALKTASESNPRLIHAEAQISIHHGRKLQALSPSPLSIAYHEEDIISSGSIGNGGQRIYTISQDLDIPLLTGARGRLYGALTEASHIGVEYTRRSIKAETIHAYALLFARERQVALQRQNATRAKKAAEIAHRRYEAGETSSLEALQAKARNTIAGQALREREMLRDEASQRLSAAMGIPITAGLETTDTLSALAAPAALPDTDELILEHPSVKMAQYVKEGYESDRGWRWMEYLPAFSISAFRQEYSDLGRFWGVEFGLQIPVWLLLSPRGAMEESSGSAMEAHAQYEITRADAAIAIRNALASFRNAEMSLLEYDSSLRAVGLELQRATELGFDSGELTYLEFVSAMESANQLLMGYYDVLAAYYEAAGRFELETGIDLIRE